MLRSGFSKSSATSKSIDNRWITRTSILVLNMLLELIASVVSVRLPSAAGPVECRLAQGDRCVVIT